MRCRISWPSKFWNIYIPFAAKLFFYNTLVSTKITITRFRWSRTMSDSISRNTNYLFKSKYSSIALRSHLVAFVISLTNYAIFSFFSAMHLLLRSSDPERRRRRGLFLRPQWLPLVSLHPTGTRQAQALQLSRRLLQQMDQVNTNFNWTFMVKNETSVIQILEITISWCQRRTFVFSSDISSNKSWFVAFGW